MKAYLLDQPDTTVTTNDLNDLGIYYQQIDADNYEEPLNQLCKERGYKNRDFVKLNSETPDLDKKLDMFFKEHYHEDEEIRFILDGEGLFDVRNNDDKWVRIVVQKSDLIILPKDIYHRFTITDSKYIHAMRLFTDAPKWEAIPRA